jgi:glycosyltransferase involved in cell wall biosynthesis
MKISIVTISFNQARFLEQAICSVINQDYPDIEYIVVDPGSTDGSREIIEKYRDRISKIIFEPDEGPADGLNKSFACATGEIYGFINADDALLPGALRSVAKAMIKKPETDVVCGHIYKVDKDLRLIRRLRATIVTPYRYVYGGVQITQQGTFFRKLAYYKTGGFNTKNRTSWDGELLLNIALTGGQFFVLNKYLALFRVYDDSISGSDRLKNEYAKDCERYFQKVIGRSYQKRDRMVSYWFKLIKWAHDPKGLLDKVYDALVNPHLKARVILPEC